jgi:hypothetical protein
MSHMNWVARQNKLELPNDEEEVNIRDIHKCDGQAHDPDTMAAPLTPKPTRKAEALAKATIASRTRFICGTKVRIRDTWKKVSKKKTPTLGSSFNLVCE